jgi:hypothetical protein
LRCLLSVSGCEMSRSKIVGEMAYRMFSPMTENAGV